MHRDAWSILIAGGANPSTCSGTLAGARARLCNWLERPRVQHLTISLVLLNAVTLGLETVPHVMQHAAAWLNLADDVLLSIFVIELSLKIFAYGAKFFRSGWNLFDFAVISVALLPASESLSVFRALRVLRILRLVSAVPAMRLVVESLARSLPGLGSIALLLTIFFYVFAVVATKLFSSDFPQWFADLGASLFSLFQIMTLEGWSDIARAVMERYDGAWLFFVAFILLATFTVLNLFIALIVKAMEEPGLTRAEAKPAPSARDIQTLRAEIVALRSELRSLQRKTGTWRRSSPYPFLKRAHGQGLQEHHISG